MVNATTISAANATESALKTRDEESTPAAAPRPQVMPADRKTVDVEAYDRYDNVACTD
jgi:hypothetical protein